MKLCLSYDDRRLAGVCGGLAKNLGLDSGRLRIVWVLATIFTAFAGVVIYLATMVSDAGRTAARARLRPAAVAAVEKVGVNFYGRN
jgi:phage shock protein PspC (stress-responsive transcriptional regulator)